MDCSLHVYGPPFEPARRYRGALDEVVGALLDDFPEHYFVWTVDGSIEKAFHFRGNEYFPGRRISGSVWALFAHPLTDLLKASRSHVIFLDGPMRLRNRVTDVSDREAALKLIKVIGSLNDSYEDARGKAYASARPLLSRPITASLHLVDVSNFKPTCSRRLRAFVLVLLLFGTPFLPLTRVIHFVLASVGLAGLMLLSCS